MGLRADIFKHPLYAKCSNRGISETHSQVVIVNADGPFEPTADAPAVLVNAHGRGILRVIPAVHLDGEWLAAPGWWMAGGAYVASSDSRLSDLCRKLLSRSIASAIAKALQGADTSKRGVGDLAAAADLLDRVGLGPSFYGAISFHDRTEG